MIRKMLGVFTAIVAGLAVVGMAWATVDVPSSPASDAGPSPIAIETNDVSGDGSTATTDVTTTGATTPDDTTPTTVRNTTSTSDDDGSASSTSTSIASSPSTSAANTTSTSVGQGSTTSTTVGSSTSTSLDDSDARRVPDGVTTYQLAGVGSITIEVFEGRLYLSSVSAPGWSIEEQRVESDRIEIELTKGEAEAEFEARIKGDRVEVKTEIDSD